MLSPSARVAEVVTRTEIDLQPDPQRVITQLFVPGEELPSDASRASPLMQRVLDTVGDETDELLADVMARFVGRHPALATTLADHFAEVAGRLGSRPRITPAQQALLGAYFTSEYAVEAAALCNPSMVAHPDQAGLAPGQTRFVLSLRGVGEGHISSIQFRTGTVDAAGGVVVDPPSGLLARGHIHCSAHQKDRFATLVLAAGAGGEIATMILDALPPTFSTAELEVVLGSLHGQVLSRRVARHAVEVFRSTAADHYRVDFGTRTQLDERILFPHGPRESHGMEDARFVRFSDGSAPATYFATYTAFDGAQVAPQLLRTDDFTSFRVSPLTGPAAQNKGLAIFPRLVDGRYVALSRWDRERTALTTSQDAHHWEEAVAVQVPTQPWELVQIGNCGAPIETAEGWLVLTHGVGPLRTYSIGAALLDLDRPDRLRAHLATPLMVAEGAERDGYVPNVVYSCGGMRHGDRVVFPFARSDRTTGVALIDLEGLLDCLLRP